MIPNHLSALTTLALMGMRLVHKSPSKTEALLMRLDRAEKAHLERMASPAYHAALAKRERKREKLRGVGPRPIY